jgi:hypothetical protein
LGRFWLWAIAVRRGFRTIETRQEITKFFRAGKGH